MLIFAELLSLALVLILSSWCMLDFSRCIPPFIGIQGSLEIPHTHIIVVLSISDPWVNTDTEK